MQRSHASKPPLCNERADAGRRHQRAAARLTPIAQALALMMLAGSVHAAPAAFSSGWFAAKGAAQSQARSSGLTSGGGLAGIPTIAQQQQRSRQQLQRSLDNLSRTASAIAAQQAAQAAARMVATNAPSDIPDGLAEGGLKVDTNSLTKGWTNAQAPMQTVSGGKTTVKIQQTADKAILNWETFNVGRNTTVAFQQQADWAVLNRVNDPQARPSRIQGQVTGAGTVMILNRNGVIFSGGSQVNTRNLVAAAASMTDGQFTRNGIYSAQSGAAYTPSFTDAGGKLIVEAGAHISTSAPGSVTQGGGYVLLLGQQVSNAGDIETPKGQAALAAGDSFAIRKGYGTDDNKFSTTVGNEISPNSGSTGQVINTGFLLAREGDITLAAHDVRQNGAAVATTTVSTRGTIHLLNSAGDTTGKITLGSGATTAVLIDDDGTTTALDSQRDALSSLNGNPLATAQFDNLSTLPDRRDESRIEIVSGGDAVFEGGSMTLATGGQISVSAARRSFVAAGASLDVAGAVGVQVAMDSNNILVNVQGNELRDAPVNRDTGKLANNDIWVDTSGLLYVPAGVGGDDSERWYTAGGLLEVGGYLSNQGHRIGEWASLGGTVALSGNEVVTQAGSQINISGGSIDVATGYLKQTWLRGPDGKLYNVNNAPGDLTYSGVYKGYEDTHARWGDTATRYFFNPLIGPQKVLRNGYTVGRDAGQLIVSSPTGVLEGDIVAAVYNGPSQVNSRPDGVTDGYKLAQDTAALGGQLVVGQYTGFGLNGGLDSDMRVGDIGGITQGMAASDALAAQRVDTIWLDAAYLSAQDLGGLTMASTDSITVDAPLTLSPGGQLSFIAPNIAIKADITAHGGEVSLGNEMSTRLTEGKPFWVALNDDQGKSQVAIDSGAKIDLSGLWLNQQVGGPDLNMSDLAFLNGGTVNVATTGGVTFASGSIIDVSSGGAILLNGKTQGGRGGNVTLVANDDTRFVDFTAPIDPSAPLIVEGEIIAYGFNGGGTLTLKAGQTVVIGDDAALTGGNLSAGTPAAISVRLARDVVIPAGGRIPFDYTDILSSVPVDTPLATAFSPILSAQNTIVTAANWVVPNGVLAFITNSNGTATTVAAGGTVPSGSTVTSITPIPAGTIIPSSVFPHGIPIAPILLDSYTADSIVGTAVTLPAGIVVPVGAKFDQSVAIQPVLALGANIFRSGFSSYSVSSNTGLEIASAVAAEVPVYRFNASSFSAATGARAADAADLWLPSTYLEDPLAGRLTQRAGASLTFGSLYDFNMTPGSSLAVDPGQNVTIYANRQTTIQGSIVAHGGSIAVTSVPDAPTTLSYGGGFGILTPTRSIWIGEGSTLDVSAQAAVAVDDRGHRYGTVPDGGSITLGGSTAPDGTSVASDAFIIVRPGAVLDASGAAGTIDVSSASGSQPTLVASNGGEISLYSASGMYLDGDLRAASGGSGAAGGLLSLSMLSHAYDSTLPSTQLPFAVGEIPEEMQRLRNVSIVQHDTPASLPADLVPGQRDAALQFGNATISVDKIHNGGFDQLALATHDLFVFSGNVDLAMNRSIVLSGGMIAASASNPRIDVHLQAPYVKLDGWYTDPSAAIVDPARYYTGLNSPQGPSLNTAADSTFAVDADLIDVSSALQFGVHGHQGSGSIFFAGVGVAGTKPAQIPGLDDDSMQTSGPHIVDEPGFGEVTLHSLGDVRFDNGSLVAGKSLAIQADRIYPVSGATATIVAGQILPLNDSGGIANTVFDPDAVLTLRANGRTAIDTPPSVFGNLAIIAPNIDQGGIVSAPLGVVAFNSRFGTAVQGLSTTDIVFRDGSVTSTSAGALTIPFGGTTDGVTYQGADGTTRNLGATSITVNGSTRVETGLMISGQQVTGEPGAVLDVSGGGDLLGAGFISGRGGSVNVLATPLVNANPANNLFSSAGDKVYAILPGALSSYAPLIAAKGSGDPAIGEQITIPAGTPGLPGGTYTLLPSSYALMPGAYRVELGSRVSALAGPVTLGNGSVITNGYLGFANTAIQDALPTRVILTGGQSVRKYSQYNETRYADFLRAQADLFGGIRPRLPIDGGVIQFGLGVPSSGKALSFAGSARFDGENGGVGGTLVIGSSVPGGVIDIVGSSSAAVAGHVTVAAQDIDVFSAPSLMIGGVTVYNDDSSNGAGGRIYFSGQGTVNVLDGAALKAGQIFLTGSAVNIAGGAMLDTRSQGSSGVDSTLGYLYGNTDSELVNQSGPAVLAVANGWFNFLPFVGAGSISVDSGASLLTEGSIVLGAPGALSIGDANLGARYLAVTQDTVNIGTGASLAAALENGQLPSGWDLTQAILDRLLRPSTTSGVPALEQLTIVAGNSINFFGDVSLDAHGAPGHDIQFVVNTPALYGLGGTGETAHLSADAFVWNGIQTGNGVDHADNPNGVPYGSKDPGAILPNGPGTGSGMLDISAESVLFGYGDHSRATDGASLNRYAIGFAAVNVNASEQVTTNSDGALFVGLGRDNSGTVHGGDLNVTTPLLTARQGAVMAFNAGGAITVAAPTGVATADTTGVTDLGGTVSFNADSVVFDTAAALPSGKLTLQALGDISIGRNAVIDLSGRYLSFFDKSAYSWGGDLVLQSAHGDIEQAAGSLIDVSAQNNVAGTITATAIDPAHGNVLFDGALRGSSTGDYASGQFIIGAQNLGGFAALNEKLNDAGLFQARSFDIKRGDLAIGNEVKAHSVSISVDDGDLTVNGTIDASDRSGDTPGTIRLAASGDLMLAPSAVLDVSSARLKTDSYGAPIEADNTSHVELTTTNGKLTLSPGATIDMRVKDPENRDQNGQPVDYGHLEINVPRLGATGPSATSSAPVPDAGDGTLTAGANGPANAQGNDVNIDAAGQLNIRGAKSIALNAFATYTNAPVDPSDAGSQIITQKYLDLIDQDSQAFIRNIYGGDVGAATLTADLRDKLSGLTAYGDGVFHIRPGVEISSSSMNGNLSIQGDLDFSGYRYGPNSLAGVLGAGEPGKVVIRAGGDLKINGSITDGFGAPPWTPDEGGFQTAIPSTVADHTIVPAGNVTLAEPWTIPVDDFYNALNFGVIADVNFNLYFPGDTVPAGTTILVDPSQGAEFAWEAGITIPALANPGPPRPIYALAQPLAPGSMSWSMRLVSGADIEAADSRILSVAAALDSTGNMLLNDLHVGGSDGKPVTSVIRTGTGDLELLAGGNFTQSTPYGIYTAGTQIPVTGDAYNPGRGRLADDGTVLGASHSDYEATLGGQYMYYMENGGDLLLNVQGNIDGSLAFDSKEVGGWLWREGGAELGQATAWGINFGSYTASPSIGPGGPDFTGVIVHLSAFSGIGTLGGGNVSVSAGGDIGDAGGVVFAVGGSGRVVNGDLVQTGGGSLSVKAGGNFGGAGNQFVDLRGDTDISAGNFGSLYGQGYGFDGIGDPRPLDALKTYSASLKAGGAFIPGDGVVDIRARGDLVMGDIVDPGRVRLTEQTDAGMPGGEQAATWFTLWTKTTAVDMLSAGGSLSPLSASQGSDVGTGGTQDNATTTFLPSILRATAGNGDIFLSPGQSGASLMLPSPSGELRLLAAGSVIDTEGTYAYGPLATSTSTLATPFHPGWATYSVDNTSSTLASSNYWADPDLPPDSQGWKAYSFSFGQGQFGGVGGNPFVFGPNTVSDASAFGSSVFSTVYALQGDILNLRYGEIFAGRESAGGVTVLTDYYRAAKPVQVRSGGDIVNIAGLIIQNDSTDVSTIAASGNVIYAGAGSVDAATGRLIAGLEIAGPGTLEVSAGKNLYQGSSAAIESIGPLIAGDDRPGASVVLQAGLGNGAPGEGQVDWKGFSELYLDPANRAGAGSLADQPGKVAKTYDSELVNWLKNRFGYAGAATDALAYFLTLPAEQQHIFLREVYYAELTAGGREFNDQGGPRAGSYLRGREAIAALFPNDEAYGGSITAFTQKSGNAGASNVSGFVHTDFGGDIQLLAPGGGVTIGTEGVVPGADSGLITQGQGDIQIYSRDSLLLGLSRIMTTFGGNIVAWSATGDINAGRGSKTTVVFTPPKLTYDDVGDVTLAPQVPSTGAGIATLRPIPEVPAGDVDLIAPLGTIDAGEAGIRVSGNINVAALHIANAANIQVQGKSTGIPVAVAVNTSALTSASAAASTAAGAAQDVMRQHQAAARNALPSIITVQVLGFGSDPVRGTDVDGDASKRDSMKAQPVSYDPASAVQMLGVGQMNDAQRARLTDAERNSLGM